MTKKNLNHFIKVSLTVYIFSMFIFSIWSYLQYLDLANLNPNREWTGSLCYLPHGSRVLMLCFFRYYSLPALYLVEISGPLLIYDEGFVDGWSFASLGSLASVIISIELVRWSNIAPGKFSLFKPINFKNYKYLFLVIVISACLNGLFANLIISLISNSIMVNVITVFRFMVGDILGACAVVLALWVIFTTLVDNRLVISPDE